RDTTLCDHDGHVIAVEGIGKDITERHADQKALQKAHEELENRVRERTAELVAKNEQLRQTQDRYLSVIHDHLEFIIRWRDDAIRTFVNDSYCQHCYQPAERLIGTSSMTAIVEEDREELRRKLDGVHVDQPVVVHEHRTMTPAGDVVWERWTH